MVMGRGHGQRAALPARTTSGAVATRIHEVRGARVMLAEDLAELYGVETKALNQAVRRNRSRFPDDFMFQLTAEEAANLRSQTVTSSQPTHGGRRYRPNAFTEQGVAMLSSVLRSPRAIAVNIIIMRAFVQLRHAHGQYAELRQLIAGLAQQVGGHDRVLRRILDVLDQLQNPPAPARRPLGFRPPDQRTTAVRVRSRRR